MDEIAQRMMGCAKFSRTYPYNENTQINVKLLNAQHVPVKVIDYLLDKPYPEFGYQPPDDDSYARCRLKKLIYYDNEECNGFPIAYLPDQKKTIDLPNWTEIRKIRFNPADATNPPNAKKGYRIFSTESVTQTQDVNNVLLRCYEGRNYPRSDIVECSLVFEIISEITNNCLSDGTSRIRCIEQAIVESLNGTIIDGVGHIYYDRYKNPSCGSEDITDKASNVGRILTMGYSYKW